MSTVVGLNIFFYMTLILGAIHIFQMKFQDSNNMLGSIARASQVIYG